jgi:hypothetical protein
MHSDQILKLLRVIGLQSVCEFVDDKVVHHDHWRLENSPVERKRTRWRAGTPSILKVANPDSLICHTHRSRKCCDSGWQNFLCLKQIPSAKETVADVPIGTCHFELPPH